MQIMKHAAGSTLTRGPNATPAFGFNGDYLKPGKLMEKLDYVKPGVTSIPQCMLIYATLIAGRTLAGFVRGQEIGGSFNEAREHAIRDTIGAAIWFFTKPIFEKFFLSFFEDGRKLINFNEPIPKGDRLLDLWKWRIKASYRGSVPLVPQLKGSEAQELAKLGGEGTSKPAAPFHKRAKVMNYYTRLRRLRSTASGLGWILTIIGLGVLIPLFNIIWTNRNVAKKNAINKASKQHKSTQWQPKGYSSHYMSSRSVYA